MKRYSGPKDRLDVALSPDTPSEELADLSRSPLTFVREAVSENPSAAESVLDELLPSVLSSEDDFRICTALVRNPSLTPDRAKRILERIVDSKTQIEPRRYYATMLVDTFARSEIVPSELLRTLANEKVFPNGVRRRLAAPGVRPELLKLLANDRSEVIRKRAAKALAVLGD